MNLYLISQNVVTGYDTYDSAVVVADSEEEARSIHPREIYYVGKDWYEPWDGKWDKSEQWCAKEDVTVKFLGVVSEGLSGVICSSFKGA